MLLKAVKISLKNGRFSSDKTFLKSREESCNARIIPKNNPKRDKIISKKVGCPAASRAIIIGGEKNGMTLSIAAKFVSGFSKKYVVNDAGNSVTRTV